MSEREVKWIVWLVVAALGMCSCNSLTELGSGTFPERPGSGTDGGGEDIDGQQQVEPMKSVYYTGVEYPYGVPWTSAIGTSVPGSKVFLMKDEFVIVELDVGEEEEVSADADMHRCFGGHLFTDFSTSDETVIKKDGEDVLRYQGRERIGSLYEKDGILHTIGIRRDGSGWTYRQAGQIVLSGESTAIPGALYEDGGSIWFSYGETASVPGAARTVCLVRDGMPSVISPSGGMGSLRDAAMVGGVLHYVAESLSGSALLFCSGDNVRTLQLPPGVTDISRCSLVLDRATISGVRPDWPVFVSAIVSTPQGDEMLYWEEGSDKPISLGTGYSLYGECADGSTYCCILDNIYCDSMIKVRFIEGNTMIPALYDCRYGGSICAYMGTCMLALVNIAEDNAPMIWKNGMLTKFGFNGIFTGISVW